MMRPCSAIGHGGPAQVEGATDLCMSYHHLKIVLFSRAGPRAAVRTGGTACMTHTVNRRQDGNWYGATLGLPGDALGNLVHPSQ